VGKPRVVGLGLCVVDHLYVVERLAPEAPRTRYAERLIALGGMTATALAQAAALGCEAHALSVVGDDAEGRFVRRSLRELGVRTARLAIDASAPTTVAVMLVARRGGERRFLVPDRRRIEARAPDLDLHPIGPGCVLLLDGHFPEQALRAARRARAAGAPVVGDFHTPRPAVRRLLPHVDYPIVPREFAEAYAGPDPRATLHRLREEHGGTPVVTLGARGGLYLDGGRVRRFRSPRVRARDTTGAGDVFHGAFAAALGRGLALPAALERAAHAAARCCTALGGTGHLRAARRQSR
jgi:sulfofructose kinase